MFDVPADVWYLWLGLSVVGVVGLGVATELPRTTPPDASRVATTVDSVAASDHAATARQPVAADRIRLGSERVGLAGAAGRSYASFAYGPVVPVGDSQRLQRVLDGAPPESVFPDVRRFHAATSAAQSHSSEWRPAPDSLTVRHVNWGDTSVTLVGA